MAKKERIDKILARIREIAPDPLNRDNTVLDQSPAVKVINSVLSLGLDYRTVVKPKLDAFQENNPDVIQVSDLANLIARYPTPIDFLAQEFGYKHKPKSIRKANAINSICEKLCGIINASPSVLEEDAIKQWALQAKPEGYRIWNIKEFRLAGFQWLRMLFGADTVKPDRHIINFLSHTLNPQISPLESVELIEETSAHSEFSARDIDRIIWNLMSKKER
ncbi:MAG: hypothetical protein OXL96_11220 [Candidatus Poribacteria bacterium]|nr:hypothetical protein [Candidatus Poribacteria bacterium]